MEGLNGFDWIDNYKTKEKTSIETILETKKNGFVKISNKQRVCISVWQKFLDALPKTESLKYPIWAMEFGATYPFESETPYSISDAELSKTKGSFGVKLSGHSRKEMFSLLPTYAQAEQNEFPIWKVRFIKSNRELYKKYKSELDPIIPLIKELPIPSWRKFEWNSNSEPRIIKKQILQFRSFWFES